jgi:hypothetical protein
MKDMDNQKRNKFYMSVEKKTGYTRVYNDDGLIALFTDPDAGFDYCTMLSLSDLDHMPILITKEAELYELN